MTHIFPIYASSVIFREVIRPQISPTVVSLKGRLPQKLQSKYTPSWKIVQLYSLFRHGFIKKQKSQI